MNIKLDSKARSILMPLVKELNIPPHRIIFKLIEGLQGLSATELTEMKKELNKDIKVLEHAYK